MRACDDCQGTGTLGGIRCPRCADMPTLRTVDFKPSPAKWWMFKPDPLAVERWCFVHGSRQYGIVPSICERRKLLLDDTLPCDIGWVETPTRLTPTIDPWETL